MLGGGRVLHDRLSCRARQWLSGDNRLQVKLAWRRRGLAFGTADEVAKLARFLLSSDSSFIIGEDILVDGGVRLT